MTRIDFERTIQAQYAELEGKVVRGWAAEREAAFGALLAVVGGTADGAPPDDILDYTDAAWARAEALLDGSAEPANDAERAAVERCKAASP
jgi:hypothetical protein